MPFYFQVAPLQYKETDPPASTETGKFPSTRSSNRLRVYNGRERKQKQNAVTAEYNNVHIPVLPSPEAFPGDCDVKTYILSNAKWYDGDASFLRGPTTRTQKALQKFKELLAMEREKGGVLAVDTETPSTITSHGPGYLLSKEEDLILGLQADEPLKRTCKPRGGFGVVKKALEAYGYEPGEQIKVYQTDVTTHNDLTFSIYTDKVSKINVAKHTKVK